MKYNSIFIAFIVVTTTGETKRVTEDNDRNNNNTCKDGDCEAKTEANVPIKDDVSSKTNETIPCENDVCVPRNVDVKFNDEAKNKTQNLQTPETLRNKRKIPYGYYWKDPVPRISLNKVERDNETIITDNKTINILNGTEDDKIKYVNKLLQRLQVERNQIKYFEIHKLLKKLTRQFAISAFKRLFPLNPNETSISDSGSSESSSSDISVSKEVGGGSDDSVEEHQNNKQEMKYKKGKSKKWNDKKGKNKKYKGENHIFKKGKGTKDNGMKRKDKKDNNKKRIDENAAIYGGKISDVFVSEKEDENGGHGGKAGKIDDVVSENKKGNIGNEGNGSNGGNGGNRGNGGNGGKGGNGNTSGGKLRSKLIIYMPVVCQGCGNSAPDITKPNKLSSNEKSDDLKTGSNSSNPCQDKNESSVNGSNCHMERQQGEQIQIVGVRRKRNADEGVLNPQNVLRKWYETAKDPERVLRAFKAAANNNQSNAQPEEVVKEWVEDAKSQKVFRSDDAAKKDEEDDDDDDDEDDADGKDTTKSRRKRLAPSEFDAALIDHWISKNIHHNDSGIRKEKTNNTLPPQLLFVKTLSKFYEVESGSKKKLSSTLLQDKLKKSLKNHNDKTRKYKKVNVDRQATKQ